MRVLVVGTGHVGLVTCAALASVGHDVVGIDADPAKLELLEDGVMPFFEPGLGELVAEQRAAGHLQFVDDFAIATKGVDVAFICVGTPPMADGRASLAAVERSARSIARSVDGPITIVEKSTVPAGTAEHIELVLPQERSDIAFDVVSNPEFLREGHAVEDALHPDRILIGARSPKAFSVMRQLYAPFVQGGSPLIETDIATAELAKHACNAFLAMKVSYVNALARVCERAGADVLDVVAVMSADERISPHFLEAGLGWGGFCFPKDVMAFEHLSAQLGYDFGLLREIARINDEALAAVVEKVREALWNLEGKRVAILGLAFKPDTDDVRFSPSLALARELLAAGVSVVGYDPQALENAKAELPELQIATDPYEACAGAHCVVIATAWEQFTNLDLDRVRSLLAQPLLIDARNIFRGRDMAALGFTYYPVGRPTATPVTPTPR